MWQFDNLMTRMLAGDGFWSSLTYNNIDDTVPVNQVSRRMFDKAVANLDFFRCGRRTDWDSRISAYKIHWLFRSAVGVVECLHLFRHDLYVKFGLKTDDFTVVNSNPEETPKVSGSLGAW